MNERMRQGLLTLVFCFLWGLPPGLQVSLAHAGPGEEAGQWLLRGWQKYVSPVDGASCTFYPSCSSYAGDAIGRHGLLAGVPIAAERLMRYHHPKNPARYTLAARGKHYYYLDPVAANDFWWSSSEGGTRRPEGGVETEGALPESWERETGERADPFRFAHHLQEEGHWQQALLVFQRFCYLEPADPLVPEALLGMGRCYEQGGDFQGAVWVYRRVVSEHGDADASVAREAAYGVGLAAYRGGDYLLARSELEEFLAKRPFDPWQARARYRKAWALVLRADYRAAEEEFLQLAGSDGPYGEPSRALGEGLGQIGSLPRRSPWLAGVLSALVPGVGQLYAGAGMDGLLAFLVNGVLFAATWEAMDKEVYVAGGLVAGVSLTFYTGNIYGAVNSAHHANSEKTSAHLRPLRERYEWLSEPGDSPWSRK